MRMCVLLPVIGESCRGLQILGGQEDWTRDKGAQAIRSAGCSPVQSTILVHVNGTSIDVDNRDPQSEHRPHWH